LIVLVIFMLQNTRPVLVTFFSLEGAGTSANALLIAGIGVGLISLVVGTVRIGQLRRGLSQERRSWQSSRGVWARGPHVKLGIQPRFVAIQDQ
jgi:lipopolysaccharide assembly protein A